MGCSHKRAQRFIVILILIVILIERKGMLESWSEEKETMDYADEPVFFKQPFA